MSERSLVTLMHEITQIETLLIESGGEMTPLLEEAFDLTKGEIRTKADSYKIIMDAMDARSVYFKERADEMVYARRIFENHKQRLKDNLKFFMHATAQTDLEGYDWRWKLTPLKDRLVIDEKALPPEYFKTETIQVVDRERIEGDLVLGTEIAGVTREPSEMLRSYVNKVAKAKPVKEVSNGRG